jgi:hypothetical protein
MIILAVKNEHLDFGGRGMEGGAEGEREGKDETEVFHGDEGMGEFWP